MTGNKYQELASRTNDGGSTKRLWDKMTAVENCGIDLGEVFNACLGLAGEVGEMNDMIKKWVFHEKELNFIHLKKELGDVMWYVAMMCQSMDWNLDDILQMNVDKLKARYPEGFDVIKANNRQEGDV